MRQKDVEDHKKNNKAEENGQTPENAEDELVQVLKGLARAHGARTEPPESNRPAVLLRADRWAPLLGTRLYRVPPPRLAC